MSKNFLFTSESVTEGHPDKMADQISDGVLDSMLQQDPMSRVACETMVTTGLIVVAGEITTKAIVDVPGVVRNIVKEIGYSDSKAGFDYNTCGVAVSLDKQSPDIAMGVDREGAGDQGMMFGLAINETEELMPLPISLAHKLTKKLAEVRKKGAIDSIWPDGKSQVTVEYKNDKPTRVDAVVISTQHKAEIDVKDLKPLIEEKVIKPIIPGNMIDKKTKIFVNPTGRFVVGGPQGDCGLTGRKIIVDTYGGYGRHGGGCFSGKDPTKVDRSAAYMMRYVAKNIVASGIASKCEIHVAYAIGVAEPVSVTVDTFGTGKFPEEEIEKMVREVFGLKPREIIKALDLRKPIYRKTAAYGHFGRKDFSWEKTDKIKDIKSYFKI
ncbi:MAG: methionine adenosyltransferase [Spirochaetes bacterium]|nr:methionine adenosyltransferase [Spirochaetota bacterium]